MCVSLRLLVMSHNTDVIIFNDDKTYFVIVDVPENVQAPEFRYTDF